MNGLDFGEESEALFKSYAGHVADVNVAATPRVRLFSYARLLCFEGWLLREALLTIPSKAFDSGWSF